MKYLKIALTVALISLVASTSFAGERQMASKSKSCKHTDGYGEYQGSGQTIHAARSQATEQCVMSKIDAYERRNGEMPDEDTVDMIMDSCVNICR